MNPYVRLLSDQMNLMHNQREFLQGLRNTPRNLLNTMALVHQNPLQL